MNYILFQMLLQRDVIIIYRVMLNSFQHLRWMRSHAWLSILQFILVGLFQRLSYCECKIAILQY